MCEYKELEENPNYLIYSDGRLYSKKTKRFLVGMVDNSGYHCYLLRIDNKSKFMRTNRLVATYFVQNPDNLSCVNHKDGDKLNNDYSNLEWVTYSENIKKYYQNKEVISKKKAHYFYDEDGEEWKGLDKIGFSKYEVSSLGNVRRKKDHRGIKPDDYHGYARVILLDDNKKRKHFLVHRLVYSIFNDDYNIEGYDIDHIDNNRRNNEISNLQKLTKSENSRRQPRFNR